MWNTEFILYYYLFIIVLFIHITTVSLLVGRPLYYQLNKLNNHLSKVSYLNLKKSQPLSKGTKREKIIITVSCCFMMWQWSSALPRPIDAGPLGYDGRSQHTCRSWESTLGLQKACSIIITALATVLCRAFSLRSWLYQSPFSPIT